MIEMKELRALRGPNRYSHHTSIFMVLDIKDYEQRPSDKIPGFTERLLEILPTLREHECSIGAPGGFVQRLNNGTWAGHIIEHIALELQCLAGMEVSFGKTFGTSIEGVYVVVFRYLVESAGLRAATEAITLFESVAEHCVFNINKAILDLKILREADMLGPTTWSIVKEAQSRGIPYIRLNDDSHIQLGYGASQKRIQASITSQTSAIAVEEADEKSRSKSHLEESGIPVPRGRLASSEEEAVAAYLEIDGPVVVKPNVGNHGKGATINVLDLEHLKKAYHLAFEKYPEVIVEEFVEGHDYRLLVIDGKFIAAAKREPAHVIGDGLSTIETLVDQVNRDPRRGYGHEKVLTQIIIDDMTQAVLASNTLDRHSIPTKGEIIYLKATANLSQGGTATDVTDEVNPEIRMMAERTSKIIGLDCIGVDALTKDISLPLSESGIKVVEVNAAPGFRMHLEPTNGQARNVAKPMVDMLFPDGYVQTPIVGVTGTNGKTTTCKLIAHTLKYAGKLVGLACTTGVEIDGMAVISGDFSGPEGAKIVLREPTIDHIVLEIARGGIQRRGLGVEELDVGVLLNIGSDHIGTDWIESQEDLILVKSTVIESVKMSGGSIINADDSFVMGVIGRARGEVTLFSLEASNPHLIQHVSAGGSVVTLENRNVIYRRSELDIVVCALEEIPITFGGIVDFNTQNALAAIGALFSLNLTAEQVRSGLTTFYPSPNQNPGRLNLFDFQTYKVLIDYGHNVEAARALGQLLPRLSKGRKIALCHGTGSRSNEQIIGYGKALAALYVFVVIADLAPRDRPSGETAELLRRGFLLGGFDPNEIELITNKDDALERIFSRAQTGDLVVIHPDKLEPIMDQVTRRYQEAIGSIGTT
ncbi:MAG: cyanophycin synthetase [Spirochaetia bacterium]|nr:cyanophycin synthetase [Spirochaetia bacterium]